MVQYSILSVLLMVQSLHAFAGYEVRDRDGIQLLCSSEDAEAQFENPPITVEELGNFVSNHCDLGSRILFPAYRRAILPEVNLEIKSSGCIAPHQIKEKLLQKLKVAPKVAGVTITLMASYILWNYGSGLFPDWLPEELEVLKPSAPTLQLIGSTVLAAPMTLPLGSWLNNKVFGLFQNTAVADPRQDESVFTSIWRWSQERLSLNGQMGRNTLNAAYEAIKSELLLMEAQMPSDTLSQKHFLIQRLAYVMLNNRHMYPDVDPSCFLLALNMPDKLGIYSAALDGVDVQREIKEALRELDLQFGEAKVEAYYDKMMLSWLPKSMVCRREPPSRPDLRSSASEEFPRGNEGFSPSETTPLLNPELGWPN